MAYPSDEEIDAILAEPDDGPPKPPAIVRGSLIDHGPAPEQPRRQVLSGGPGGTIGRSTRGGLLRSGASSWWEDVKNLRMPEAALEYLPEAAAAYLYPNKEQREGGEESLLHYVPEPTTQLMTRLGEHVEPIGGIQRGFTKLGTRLAVDPTTYMTGAAAVSPTLRAAGVIPDVIGAAQGLPAAMQLPETLKTAGQQFAEGDVGGAFETGTEGLLGTALLATPFLHGGPKAPDGPPTAPGSYRGEPPRARIERESVGTINSLLGRDVSAELTQSSGRSPGAVAGDAAADAAAAGLPPPPPADLASQPLPGAPAPIAALAEQPSKVLKRAVRQIREALSEGEAAPELVQAGRAAIAELARRGEAAPVLEVGPFGQDTLLRRLGHDPTKLDVAAQRAALEELGYRGPELEAGLPPGEKSLEELIAVAEDAPTAWQPEQLQGLTTRAREFARGDADLPNHAELTEQLRPEYGDLAELAAQRIRAQHGELSRGRGYLQEEYAGIEPPPDLQARQPDFVSPEGVKHWVARFSDEGQELSPRVMSSDGQKLVAWAEDPATGEFVQVGGITRLRGEQHYLAHGRSLGEYELPTSFKESLRAKADELGWKEAPAETSSYMAQEGYKAWGERKTARETERAAKAAEAQELAARERAAQPSAETPLAKPDGEPYIISDAELDEFLPRSQPGGPRAPGVRGAGETGPPSPPSGRLADSGPPRPPGAGLPEAVGGASRPAGPPRPPGGPEALPVAARVPAEAGGQPLGGRGGAGRAAEAAGGRSPQPAPAVAGNLALQPDPSFPPPPPPEPPAAVPGGPPPPPGVTSPQLKLPISRDISLAAGRAMELAGIDRNRERFPTLSSQMAYHVNRGEITLPALEQAAQQAGMPLMQFVDELWKPAITDAARRLQAQSAAARRLSEAVAEVAKTGKKGKEAAQAFEEAVRGSNVGITADDLIYMPSRMTRALNIWRGALVGRMASFMRDTLMNVPMVGVSGLADALDAGLQHTARAMGADVKPTVRPLDGLRIALTGAQNLLTFGTSRSTEKVRSVTDSILSAHDPTFSDKLFNTWGADIMAQAELAGAMTSPIDKALRAGQKIVEILPANYLRRASDHLLKRAALYHLLDGQASLRGADLPTAVQKHNQLRERLSSEFGLDWAEDPTLLQEFQQSPDNLANVLPEEALQGAVDKTLRMFLQENPQKGPGLEGGMRDLLGFLNKTPAGFAVPFLRWNYNAWKFVYEHSPVGPLKLLSKVEREKLAGGDPRVVSKAVIGAGLLYAAWQFRNSPYAGGAWYEAQVEGSDGKKRTVDLRPYGPFAAYVFVADLAKRWKGDRTWDEARRGEKQERSQLYTLGTKDILEGVLSTNLRSGTGLALVDTLFQSASSIGRPGALVEGGKRAAGELAAGLLTPLQDLADLYAQFDADSRVVREKRAEPFLGPIWARIPEVGKRLPPAEIPTREGELRRELPILKPALGLAINDPQNVFEQEMARLQLPRTMVYRNTSSWEADQLLRHYMGSYAEDVIIPTLLSPAYGELDDHRRRLVLQDLITTAKQEARGIALVERPDLFEALRQKSIEEQLAEAPEGPPGPPLQAQ